MVSVGLLGEGSRSKREITYCMKMRTAEEILSFGTRILLQRLGAGVFCCGLDTIEGEEQAEIYNQIFMYTPGQPRLFPDLTNRTVTLQTPVARGNYACMVVWYFGITGQFHGPRSTWC